MHANESVLSVEEARKRPVYCAARSPTFGGGRDTKGSGTNQRRGADGDVGDGESVAGNAMDEGTLKEARAPQRARL